MTIICSHPYPIYRNWQLLQLRCYNLKQLNALLKLHRFISFKSLTVDLPFQKPLPSSSSLIGQLDRQRQFAYAQCTYIQKNFLSTLQDRQIAESSKSRFEIAFVYLRFNHQLTSPWLCSVICISALWSRGHGFDSREAHCTVFSYDPFREPFGADSKSLHNSPY